MATIKKYNGSSWENAVVRKFTTATEAVENPLYSDGTAITSYTLKGNTVQNGTPTPSNPVDVNGVGELTDNLFNGTLEQGSITGLGVDVDRNDRVRTHGYIDLSSGTYTFSFSTTSTALVYAFVYDSTETFVERIPADWTDVPYTFTINSNRKIRFVIKYSDDATISPTNVRNLILNEGSTAKPYEPFGYKIPISSGQQTIDIYIGDLPLLKSLDGTAVDEISNGTLTRRVDSDGSVLPTPTTTQITMPSIPTTEGANSITVDTTVQPSEFTATWTGWRDSSVKEWDGSDWQ